jgi:hypothetical protein
VQLSPGNADSKNEVGFAHMLARFEFYKCLRREQKSLVTYNSGQNCLFDFLLILLRALFYCLSFT